MPTTNYDILEKQLIFQELSYPKPICFISNFRDQDVTDKKGQYLESYGIFGRMYLPEKGIPFLEHAFEVLDMFMGSEKIYFKARLLGDFLIISKKYKVSSERFGLTYLDDGVEVLYNFMTRIYRDFVLEPAARQYCKQNNVKYSAVAIFGERRFSNVPWVTTDDLTNKHLVWYKQDRWYQGY